MNNGCEMKRNRDTLQRIGNVIALHPEFFKHLFVDNRDFCRREVKLDLLAFESNAKE